MERYELVNRLWRYRDLKKECEQLRNEVVSLRASMEGLGAQRLSGMPTGSPVRSDRLESVIDRLSVVEERWLRCCEDMAVALDEIDQEIMLVKDSKCRQLLRFRFVDGMKWEDVAKRMGYSVDNVYKLYQKAIVDLQSITVHCVL